MADKERDARLRETARHRGFRLLKSRRRKPGGDFGRYGLKALASGDECLGFGKTGLTATADEIEAFLRQQTALTWKESLGATEKVSSKPKKNPEGRNKVAPPPSASPKRSPKPTSVSKSQPKPVPKPQLKIREADSVDAEALASLVSLFTPTTAAEIEDRLPLLGRAGERPLVARLGDELVGLITWHVTPVLHRPQPVGRITYLAVAEKVRRQGVGRRLVEAAEARLYEQGCGDIEVTSNIKLTTAHKFYRTLGFERTSYRFRKALCAAVKS
ncbi:MAG TPA: GNAT family N-acetyltransferase [Allosphingosinicella sp.]|nr:GNAT family N-acetyltransferase [Allosphingosinicella sp.]